MKKNVAAQVAAAQMIAAADGSAFTGAVTVYVTGDGGVQAVGSVGAGACTHEGNGLHTYAPAQAETNYDLACFTFVAAGAIPVTVQYVTQFPQTGDAFGRLGAPAGASVSADIAAVKAETASIQADTNDLQTRVPAALVGGRIDASVGAMAANVMTAAAAAADLTVELQTGLATAAALTAVAGDVTSIQADTNDLQTRLPAALVGGRIDASVGAMAANVMTAAAAAADLTVELQTGLATAAALTAVAGDVTSVKGKTDNLPVDPADQSLVIAATDAIMGRLGAPAGASLAADIGDVPTALENADALLKRDWSAVAGEASRSVLNALRNIRNKWSITGATLTVTKEDDATPAWTSTLSTSDTATPITGADPS